MALMLSQILRAVRSRSFGYLMSEQEETDKGSSWQFWHLDPVRMRVAGTSQTSCLRDAINATPRIALSIYESTVHIWLSCSVERYPIGRPVPNVPFVLTAHDKEHNFAMERITSIIPTWQHLTIWQENWESPSGQCVFALTR